MRVTVVRPGDIGTAEAELWWKFQHSTPGAKSVSVAYLRPDGRPIQGQCAGGSRGGWRRNSGILPV